MYPFSQRGGVTQHVAFTTIAIEYGRPTGTRPRLVRCARAVG
jgi:hypothetical protein